MKSLTLKPAEAMGMTRAEKKAVKEQAFDLLKSVDAKLEANLKRVRLPNLSGRDMEREFERGGHTKRGS